MIVIAFIAFERSETLTNRVDSKHFYETDYSPLFDVGSLVPTRRDVMNKILQAQNMCSIC